MSRNRSEKLHEMIDHGQSHGGECELNRYLRFDLNLANRQVFALFYCVSGA